MNRIEVLVPLIRSARQSYYNQSSAIADEVYDAWVDELASLDPKHPLLFDIGSLPVSEWKKVTHLFPMGSLEKVQTIEEFLEWKNKYAPAEMTIASDKLDGISIQLHYVNGYLAQATTRGNGIIGEDITTNVRRMKNVPSHIDTNDDVYVRGEILFLKSDFANEPAGLYSNTRNAASGIAKRYDGVGSEKLSILCYKVLNSQFETRLQEFQYLEHLGFKTPSYCLSTAMDPVDMWNQYQTSKRDALDYDIDGLVIEINNTKVLSFLGDKNLRPVGARAFKFNPPGKETILRNITWQVGMTGKLTPVANFDCVDLLGTKVENASIYNYDFIIEKQLDVGAKILVVRSNDVIPVVKDVIEKTGTIAQPPTHCPCCNGPIVKEVLQTHFFLCKNPLCSAQLVGRLSHYLKTIGVLEWGDVLLEKLVSAKMVSSVADLYRLTVDQLSSLDRMGKTSAKKALNLLNEKKTLPLDLFLGALSIPLASKSTIRMLMESGLDSLDKIRHATVAQLNQIHGMGDIKSESLVQWMGSNQGLIDDLLSCGVSIEKKADGIFNGLSFCFTGTMTHKRADLEKRVKDLGGTVKGSVTSDLSFLVLNDDTTSKAQAAKKKGIVCITEAQFLDKAGGL